MKIKRLRIFAGPNGSGKTTLINKLKNKIPFGIYINADDIEKNINEKGFLKLDSYHLTNTLNSKLQSFFKNEAFSPQKINEPELWRYIEIKNEAIFVNKPIHLNSYISADIAEFIRQSAMEANVSFTFETVLSHTNKLFFMQKAKEAGYKVYLYFIATENPEINIDRVKIRVAQHGHQVKEETIRSRYYRSLQNLKEAVKLSDRSYIFDNSEINKLVAEITDGSQVEVFDENDTPNWFVKYLVD